MQQILSFFIKNRVFFVFLLLFLFSFSFSVRSNYYRQSKWFNSANYLSGELYASTAFVSQYFSLNAQNQKLAQENQRLHQLLLCEKDTTRTCSTSFFKENYKVYLARVVKNSVLLSKNYITIDLGENQGITQDMAVVSPLGVVGITDVVSGNYATVQSVLNELSLLNVKLKNTAHFGSLRWNGVKLNRLQVDDVPVIAPLHIGDTIVTGGMSSIFPKNIPVGEVKSFSKQNDNTYHIEIELFTDMSALDYVYVIKNEQKQEIEQVQNTTK